MAYVSVKLRGEEVERLRRLTRQLAASADRDLSHSDTLALVLDLATEHTPELVTRLTGESAREGGETGADSAARHHPTGATETETHP